MSLGTLMKYSIPDTKYVKIFTNISGHIKNMSEGHMGSLQGADDKYIHLILFHMNFTEYSDQCRYNRPKLLII